MSFVDLAIPFFINPSNGKPVYSGSIYIGEPDTDPEIATNQKTVRLRQENGVEVVAAQPIETSIGGIPLYNGSPVQIIVDGNYSLKVLDHLGAQVYYIPSGANLTALGSLVPQIDTQTATEGQTFFTLKTGMTYTVGGNDIAIYIDGRRQYPSAYTESSETTITFTEGLAAGQEVMFVSNEIEASLSELQGSIEPETGRAVLWDGATPYDVRLHGASSIETIANNNLAIETALGVSNLILIPYGIKWDHSIITQPNETMIVDYSGYDWVNDDFTGQIKYITKTSDPSTKNAHEYVYAADYHPAFIVDNVGGGVVDKRASLILRQDGTSIWRVGKGIGNDNDFIIAKFPNAEILFSVDYETYEMAFGSAPVNGVPFHFRNKNDTTTITRIRSQTNNNAELQHENDNGINIRVRLNDNGSILFIQNGSTTSTVEADGALSGSPKKVSAKTGSYSVTKFDNNSILTNRGAAGGFTFTLPASIVGMHFKFCVVEAQNLRVDPGGVEIFRGLAAGKYTQSNTPGSILSIFCVTPGIWEVETKSGTWIDEP